MSATQAAGLTQEINEYIRQHRDWKEHLLEAINTGKSEYSPEAIAGDHECAFGKWIYSADSATRSTPQYEETKRLHAEFHQKASKVLADALAGHRDQALHDVEHGAFNKATSALVVSMMRWKRSL